MNYIIIVSIIIIIILIGVIVKIYLDNNSGPQPPTPSPKPPKNLSTEQKNVFSYLKALFPQSGGLGNLKPDDLIRLYDSLRWYYLPLVRKIDENRKGPLKGPFKNAETQWFMADGADCGDYSSTPGKFFCSVFGGACDSWEFGQPKEGGRPYQSIAFIKPYGMRNGNPSNSYIECVAFPCEALGRMLLNAPNCSSTAPIWDDFLKTKENFEFIENFKCVNDKSCDVPDADGNYNEPGCQIAGLGDMKDVCCWDYENGVKRDDVCPFPSKCMATQDTPGGKVFGNYCATPCGFKDCDVTTNCNWKINNQDWQDYFKDMEGGSNAVNKLVSLLQNKAVPYIDDKLAEPRTDKSVQSTMFYWCKGYGKFLNMGKTGIYFSYIHFILTCPKISPSGIPMRWSYPQILQTATLNGGNSTMIEQLKDLVSGKLKDNRRYLEGYVTTLRGSQYTPNDGQVVDNKMLYKTENVNGMINPLDDDNLIMIDKLTVTKYYDPTKKIRNPQYNKIIKFTPLQAIYLQQGMHIYGATGSSVEKPYVDMNCKVHKCGTWPFGVFFEGSTIGGCVYKMINMLGWKSGQFTQMPTGAGGVKYCNSPEYDYEIVYIASKDSVCKNEMVMLDPTIDLENYIKNDFVDGNKFNPKQLNVRSFNASIMRLTERNVPDDWNKPMPNSMWYGQPSTPIEYKSVCPYKDNVYNNYPNHKPTKTN